MLISGVQKTTVVDYPSKVACIVFTAGCNYRCPFCHNPESVIPEQIAKNAHDMIPESAFFSFLEKRKKRLDGVVVCGGEPTIHRDLTEFIQRIKQYDLLVKLDTNGTDPKILTSLIENKLIDYVAMDVKHSFSQYGSASGVKHTTQIQDAIQESIQYLINGALDYEFRTTVVKGLHDESSLLNLAQSIQGASKYFLQGFRPGKLLDPKFKGESYTEQDLQRFQKQAEQYVKHCGIRM